MAQFTMFAIRLVDGRFVQPSHPSAENTAAGYDFARHYSTETEARVGRKNDGRGGEIVAVDDMNEATMRVVA